MCLYQYIKNQYINSVLKKLELFKGHKFTITLIHHNIYCISSVQLQEHEAECSEVNP